MGMQQPMQLNSVPEDAWQNYLLRFDAGEGCGFQECEVEDTEHFHCKDEGCETVFRTEEGVREHGKNHFQQDQISETFFAKVDPEEPGSEVGCPTSCQYRGKEIHFHCKIVSSHHQVMHYQWIRLRKNFYYMLTDLNKPNSLCLQMKLLELKIQRTLPR